MQLFGGTFNFAEGTPASNFNSFSIAMLTVFQVRAIMQPGQIFYVKYKSKNIIKLIAFIVEYYIVNSSCYILDFNRRRLE